MLKLFYLIAASSIYATLAQTCPASYSNTFVICSSSETDIVDTNMNYLKKAVVVGTNSGWWANIPNNQWIWSANGEANVNFGVKIDLSIKPSTATLNVAVDDYASVYINSQLISECAPYGFQSVRTCNILPYLVVGANNIRFAATDTGGAAGFLFRIEIVSSR